MGIDQAIAIDITTEQRRVILGLLEWYLPDTTAWVYGSRAKWTSRPQSDLDMVVFSTPKQSIQVGELREAFEESDLPFRVDLFVWDKVLEAFREEIEAEYVVLVERKKSNVREGWSKVTLRDCVEINDATYTSGEAWSYINYLDTGNITENQISQFQRLTIGEDKVPDRARRKVQPGDIVYSTVRPAQRHFGLLKRVPKNFLVSTGFSVIRGKADIAHTDFVYWFLAQEAIINQLQVIAEHSTSAYPSIRPSDIEGLELVLPPLPEQRAIAHILDTLDDKIELNRRMNETLEAMAQALFKSWFVDFDPVRAKMTLKQHATNHSPLEGESQKAKPDAVGGQSRWGEIKRSYPKKNLNRAKSLRQNQTDAEGLLWRYLRNKQLDGYKFRRQQPIGPYIIDFACLPEKLLIELDGGQHAEHQTYDERRDQFLQSKGYRILRFWNNQVFENCFDVLEQIYQALTNHFPVERESASQGQSPQTMVNAGTDHHSPLEGESANQGRRPPENRWGENVSTSNDQVAETDTHPPPHQPSPNGSSSATPPQGGSDWNVERARAYLDHMDPEIANLFPDRLDDQGKPRGWNLIQIKQLGRVITGKTPSTQKQEFYGHDMPFLKIPDMHGRIYVLQTSTSLSEEGAKSQEQKTLPVGSISVSCIATPGLVTLSHRETQTNQQINSIIPKDRRQSNFIFWSCRRLVIEVMLGGSGGSVFHNMNKTSFENLGLVYPGEEIAQTFSKTISYIHHRILANEYGNGTLARTRDALLPKLISGEVRIREAEKTMETVA